MWLIFLAFALVLYCSLHCISRRGPSEQSKSGNRTGEQFLPYVNATRVMRRPYVQKFSWRNRTRDAYVVIVKLRTEIVLCPSMCSWIACCTWQQHYTDYTQHRGEMHAQMKNHRRHRRRRCHRCHCSTTLFPNPVKLCTACTRRILSELVKCIFESRVHTISIDGKPLPTAVSCIMRNMVLWLHHRQAHFAENSIYISHRTIILPAAACST